MPPPLRQLIQRTIILAYREDTSQLENTLRAAGLNPITQRRTYTPTEQTYSRTIRCLLNHTDAWRAAAAATDGYTLIVEADFVPCREFTDLPAPLDPALHGPLAWAFLYAGGPRIIRVLPGGYIWGHAACPVAVIVPPRLAGHLVEFSDELIRTTPDLTAYSLWDTIFQWHMMGHNAKCFMPYRHYGEHGGLPNPEHKAAGAGLVSDITRKLNITVLNNHHAECLQRSLAFLPAYARGSRWIYLRTRLLAKCIGLARVVTGRVVESTQPMSRRERLRAYWIACKRLCSVH